MKPHFRLLLALVLGATFGVVLHPFSDQQWLTWIQSQVLDPIGQIFLRMIFMVVVPMVFSALILGVYELGEGHHLKKVAGRTLLYTVIASSASVAIGITLVNLLRPGDSFQLDRGSLEKQSQAIASIQSNAAAVKPIAQTLVQLIPKNPLDSAVRALDGEMVSLMVFALIFGIALSSLHKTRSRDSILIQFHEQIFSVSMKIVEFAMRLAPMAVFSLVFSSAFKHGHQILISLALYVGTVLLGLLIQQLGVYSLLLHFFARRSPLEFFKQCREVFLYAFATASSNATLPRALDAAENRLKLAPEVSRFVLTVGSTANQNGTALFEGITVLFLAQVYGIDLSMGQQVQVVFMSILAGIGTAGVPGGSLPLIMILLHQVGIPPEGLGLILGVDRFLDMCRTTVNVTGDLVIATVVNRKK